MLILGIDTCCMPAVSAIYDGEKIIAEAVLFSGKTHSQRIMPQIKGLFDELGISPADIDCFAVAAGPGSFTGVRIGTAAVKAMAHAAGKPCAAVSTLEALAFNVSCFDGIICPILDARRDQVYTALFRGGKALTRLRGDGAAPLSELLDELAGQKVLFAGDGVLVYRSEIAARMGDCAYFPPANNLLNSGGAVAVLGYEKFMAGETVSYSALVPNYIRLSQAERERIERENKK